LKIKPISPWLLYSLYFLSVTVFFLYYLFPADAVKGYVQSLTSQLDPALLVTIGQVRPAFPVHVRLSNVSMQHNRQLLMKADKITIAPRFFPFLTGKKGFTISSHVYDGTVKGKMIMASDGPVGQLQLSALNLEKIQALKRFDQLDPAGKLNCRLDFAPKNNTMSAEGNFDIVDFTVNIEETFPGMTALSFSSLVGKIGFSGNRLTISDVKARGRQTDAGINGALTLGNPLMESKLDLLVTIRPHAEIIAALRRNPAFQWLSAKTVGKSGFPMRIGGTVEDPEVSLQ